MFVLHYKGHMQSKSLKKDKFITINQPLADKRKVSKYMKDTVGENIIGAPNICNDYGAIHF